MLSHHIESMSSFLVAQGVTSDAQKTFEALSLYWGDKVADVWHRKDVAWIIAGNNHLIVPFMELSDDDYDEIMRIALEMEEPGLCPEAFILAAEEVLGLDLKSLRAAARQASGIWRVKDHVEATTRNRAVLKRLCFRNSRGWRVRRHLQRCTDLSLS